MIDRVELLKDPGGQQADEELFAQAALLNALFIRYAAESVAASEPDHRAKYAKLALQAQSSYTRTLIAIEALRAQRQQQRPILVPGMLTHEAGN